MKACEIFNYKSIDDFTNCSMREYSDRMCEVIRLGLVRDASLYEWMILNFNEIMDKDYDCLELMFSKISMVKSFYEAKDPEGCKEGLALEYGKCIGRALEECLGDDLSTGEYEGLGMIAASYIAYKKEMLSMDEFYEIRDMFVPFGLTISLDKFDVDTVLEQLYSDEDYIKESESMPLLKKIGKVGFVNGITKDEVRDAINSLIVEWD